MNRKILIIILILATLGLGVASIFTAIRIQENQEPEDTSALPTLCSSSSEASECANLPIGRSCGPQSECSPRAGETGALVNCICRSNVNVQPCGSGLDCTEYTGQSITGDSFRCSVDSRVAVCCNPGQRVSCTATSCTCNTPPPCDSGEMCGTGAGCGAGATCNEAAACNQECELNNGNRTGFLLGCRGSTVTRIEAPQTCPPPQTGGQCNGTAHCSNGTQDCNETGTDCGGDCSACQGTGQPNPGALQCPNGAGAAGGCLVFLCPQGCGADGRCEGTDAGVQIFAENGSCNATLDGRCGQIDVMQGSNISVANPGNFCGVKVDSVSGIQNTCGTAVCTPTTQPFCGDGIINNGETCDPAAANNSCGAGICNANCACTTPEPGLCGSTCGNGVSCSSGLTCSNNRCVLTQCANNSNCTNNGCSLPTTALISEEDRGLLIGILLLILGLIFFKLNIFGFAAKLNLNMAQFIFNKKYAKPKKTKRVKKDKKTEKIMKQRKSYERRVTKT